MSSRNFLAIDLGAESGRGMLATLDSGRMTLEEVHRFPNVPVQLRDTLYWDAPRLFVEVKTALRRAVERLGERGARLDGVGVDAWGVDYALLDHRGRLLSNPTHYRDSRLDGILERVFERLPRSEIFAATGVLILQFNTLFQLAAELEADPQRLRSASRLLFIPDLFHYWLTGRAVSERTIASTSQLWSLAQGRWCGELTDRLGIPRGILPDVLPSGSIIAPLDREIAREVGLDPALEPPPVIAGACHDTGAAVAAAPVAPGAPAGRQGFLSSGTWSLMGVEVDRPHIDDRVLDARFTNEGGADGTIHLLRIIMGLWLVQECRRDMEREGKSIDYADLVEQARAAPPLASIVVPDDPAFFPAGGMSERIREACRRSGQPAPDAPGALVRCALESLALAYRDCAESIAAITGRRIERLHVVGGGSRNELLNQLTADALGIDVVAGPAEATALGNALMQARAVGAIASRDEMREIAVASADVRELRPDPRRAADWSAAYRLYERMQAPPRGSVAVRTTDSERHARALARIDAANGADPCRCDAGGVEIAAAVVYGRRMSAWLERLAPDASEALCLAVRAQHIRRWEVPRASYPEGRAGYLRWRAALGRFHAEAAGAILAELGYDAETVARVGALLRKERLRDDPEAQTLEDVACLVFLENELGEFAPKHDRAKVLSILEKTWAKMSPRGREAALGLRLPDAVRGLLDEALGGNRPG